MASLRLSSRIPNGTTRFYYHALDNLFQYIPDVPHVTADKILGILNLGGPIRATPQSQRKQDLETKEESPRGQDFHLGHDVSKHFLSWVRLQAEEYDHHHQTVLLERLLDAHSHSPTYGYVTQDLCPGYADDVIHKPLPVVDQAEHVATAIMQESAKLIDVVFDSLLPLTLTPYPSPSPNPSADYGGDEPAILDAVICALNLLDRRPTSSFTHPSNWTQSKISPSLTDHKHVLIITALDIGPPAMSINPNTVDELPRTLPFLNHSPQYNAHFITWAQALLKQEPPHWHMHKDECSHWWYYCSVNAIKHLLPSPIAQVGMVSIPLLPRS
ncbi:hypothetical protein PCASD_17316 [Puccinia coronata f. sp. avenae]|uniref:Putative 5'-nucleotidase C-terminal domain-containing protein n=1 Tax=Puccinia coronata f. sp. avenae TaxID=200324 RepID=A0A2N5U2I1_9BASI|nr:hypothetical protein PCASD_17316 [Puccinia coronata f. sp. avenae]